MTRLMQIEWMKLPKMGNYIMLGLLIVLAAASTVVTFRVSMDGSQGFNSQISRLIIGQLSGVVNLFLVIFLITNIAREFSEKTLRRSIAEGLSRDEFYSSKILLALGAAIFIFLLFIVMFYVGGLISTKLDSVTQYFSTSLLLRTFIKFLATAAFACFLAFCFRSIWMALIVYFFWSFVEGILTIAAKYFFEEYDIRFELSHYLPLSSMHTVLESQGGVENQVIIVATLYFFLMLYVGYWMLINRDIK